jgi:membrane protease YdiL (CAAX protease family)
MAATLKRPFLGVLAAIAITTTMDATGYSALSALPLFPLMGVLWYLGRFSRRRMGFVAGRLSHYALAALYPLAVLGVLTLVTTVAGVTDTAGTEWSKVWFDLTAIVVSTIVVAVVTEEGFFRGWLWASLERAGRTPGRIIVWSGIAFSLWHVSAASLGAGTRLPAAQIPVYLADVFAMGVIWGLLRAVSGSVVVASVSHGLWNGGAYVFFGFGSKVGALGIRETGVFGPEAGVFGLVLNLVFAVALWRYWKAGGHAAEPSPVADS